ncbi:hypothetical protein EUTSA_v10026547mg [Eutrema salsugineum]|uniref:Uncharacterized protein n=1 Tax=Eutrema salsugineum TaxID=72664 RepID=V4P505_EUTSA|nr:uncharacterized protein LOC18028168 [Eutrema salsugineum]ESQ54536.1 hypothetical protein EUTSA_v10026547mg [Eutrema salsugineum]
MTKSRNKKKRDDAVSMDVSETKSVSEAAPEAMDTTETGDAKLAARDRSRNLTNMKKGIPMKKTRRNARKMKAVAKALALEEKCSEKGKPMKRTKNVRKMKAVAKAIALNEKYEEKATKNEEKTLRTISAKKLYE